MWKSIRMRSKGFCCCGLNMTLSATDPLEASVTLAPLAVNSFMLTCFVRLLSSTKSTSSFACLVLVCFLGSHFSSASAERGLRNMPSNIADGFDWFLGLDCTECLGSRPRMMGLHLCTFEDVCSSSDWRKRLEIRCGSTRSRSMSTCVSGTALDIRSSNVCMFPSTSATSASEDATTSGGTSSFSRSLSMPSTTGTDGSLNTASTL
mmetsp:Transcript_30333/g.51071  ORF Transcript_30333/g.51071 Transcript_30333/m.51071 type:complete len:206 (+) Transcript_30333:4627-5244(+)